MLYFFECEEGFVPDNGQNDVTNGSVENFPPEEDTSRQEDAASPGTNQETTQE